MITDTGALQDIPQRDPYRMSDVGELDDVEAPLAHLVPTNPFLAHTEPRGELLLVQPRFLPCLPQDGTKARVLGPLLLNGHSGSPQANPI